MFWPALVAWSATAVQNKTVRAMSQKPAAMATSFRKAFKLFHFPPMSSRMEDPWRLPPQATSATADHFPKIGKTYLAARCGCIAGGIRSLPEEPQARHTAGPAERLT